MKTSILPENSIARWYKLIDHPVQLRLMSEEKRFKVVPAGRRSGKTERAKRKIIKSAMQNSGYHYFVAAPTRDQVKKIYWNDLKLLSFCDIFPRQPSESELIIYFPNGSTISLIGLDKPQRIEGTPWSGGIVDEIADVKADAWPNHISPALDTVHPNRPDYRPWCWFIGVPDGLNHYYDLAKYAQTSQDPDWGYYSWFSSDILPDDVIKAAKRRLSPREFRQEYEASFETASGRIYNDYSVDNHTNETLKSHEQILWMHDFNFTPLSSCIAVKRHNCLYVVDEIVLQSAVSRQSALEFVEKYQDHDNKNVIIYGDPSGKAGEKHGHMSDYIEMEKVLRSAGWTVTRNVKAAAPAIKDRQNAVRFKIKNAAGEISLFVNPNRCPYLEKGLSTVQFKLGSTFLEETCLEVETQWQHITTALGYGIEYIWPAVARVAGCNPDTIPVRNFW